MSSQIHSLALGSRSHRLPNHICNYGRFNTRLAMLVNSVSTPAFTSQAWTTNNMAYYCPLSLPAGFKVERFFWVNGASLTGNVNLGLYTEEGILLVQTGDTVRANVNTIQYAPATSVQNFPAGNYYIAMVAASTAGSFFRTMASSNAAHNRLGGWLQQALANLVLPSPWTPVAATLSHGYGFGFTQSATI